MAGPTFTPARLASVLFVCAVIAALSMVLGALYGEEPISLAEALKPDTVDATLLFSLRLPRVCLAALVGAALAASGSTLQALMRNPLADPFVLGVSGGAALGATVALALGLATFAAFPGFSAVSVLALAGSLGATILVLSLGRIAGRNSSNATLLAGVIFNAFALAAITFIKALVAPDRVGEVLYWLAGALGHEQPSTLLGTAVVMALALGVLGAYSARLNLLTLGDDDAATLGVPVERTRLVLLLATSLAVSAAVALSGLVGFVGLLVPHLGRLVFGSDQRVLLPASALLGAAFLVLADLAARVLFRVFHTEPPVGVITALLGGPLFLLLLIRRERAALS